MPDADSGADLGNNRLCSPEVFATIGAADVVPRTKVRNVGTIGDVVIQGAFTDQVNQP